MKFEDSSVQLLETHTSLKGIYEDIERAGRTSYQSIGTRYFNVPDDTGDPKAQALLTSLKADQKVKVQTGPFFDHSYYVSIPNNLIKQYSDILNYEEETLETSPLYENVTAEGFVNMLKSNGHLAPLEFGTVYLVIPVRVRGCDKQDCKNIAIVEHYQDNHYSKVIAKTFENIGYTPECFKELANENGPCTFYCISTNLRVVVENDWITDLAYLSKPTPFHEKRFTARVKTSIGISREWNRSRTLSIVEESTRYCNYSKDKFDKELTFIIPQWMYRVRDEIADTIEPMTGYSRDWLKECTGDTMVKHLTCLDRSVASYWEFLNRVEDEYLYQTTTDEGTQLKPQEARGILPLDLRTRVMYCGFKSDWDHFFQLRTAASAHPDIQKLAKDLQKQINQNLAN